MKKDDKKRAEELFPKAIPSPVQVEKARQERIDADMIRRQLWVKKVLSFNGSIEDADNVLAEYDKRFHPKEQ